MRFTREGDEAMGLFNSSGRERLSDLSTPIASLTVRIFRLSVRRVNVSQRFCACDALVMQSMLSSRQALRMGVMW